MKYRYGWGESKHSKGRPWPRRLRKSRLARVGRARTRGWPRGSNNRQGVGR